MRERKEAGLELRGRKIDAVRKAAMEEFREFRTVDLNEVIDF